MGKNIDSYYYEIHVSYEIPYNVLDCSDESIGEAKDILFNRLDSIIPNEEYEKFDAKLTVWQLRDNFNYLVTYSAFFRSQGSLPMGDYVEAEKKRDEIEQELENFFKTVDCEYKKINIRYFY